MRKNLTTKVALKSSSRGTKKKKTDRQAADKHTNTHTHTHTHTLSLSLSNMIDLLFNRKSAARCIWY